MAIAAPLQRPKYGESFKKTLSVMIISAGVIFLLGFAMFSARGFGLSKSINKSSSALTVPAQPSPSSAFGVVPTEVNIANNGFILARGAIVTDVSDKIIKAKILWGATNFDLTLNVLNTTKFVSRSGIKTDISNVMAGDTLIVSGSLTSGSNQFIINADFIRNNK